MPFSVPIDQAKADYPEYSFISSLTPSEQKAAFHVQDSEGHDLCLKIISPDYNIERLDREISALQSINHPNIVHLVEYTKSTKANTLKHFMVEEFISGTDLGEQLQPGQQWARADASIFFAALFDGLAALNNLNIVHRDLKPSNIRVRTSDSSPVIIDFGVARILELTSLTNSPDGAAIGTPKYFSPEQCRGTKHDIGHRTDLFAAGCLLYQALTGKHPFWHDGITGSDLYEAICESHDYLNDANFKILPEKWQIIIGRLLNKTPANRPYSAEQVLKILSTFGAE